MRVDWPSGKDPASVYEGAPVSLRKTVSEEVLTWS